MTRPQINHVGITVSDLDRSVDFYCSMFGLEEVGRGEAGGETVEAAVGVPGAQMRVAAIAGTNTFMELIQYTHSRGQDDAPRTNDVGAAHVCFPVTDIDVAHAELVAKGARFVSPPSAPLNEAGARIAFLRDPDDIPVELVQPAEGGTLEDLLGKPVDQ